LTAGGPKKSRRQHIGKQSTLAIQSARVSF
jgi:hypothetical protein